MNHRLSEDLVFELIGLRKERPQLDFVAILGELKAKFPDAREEILGEDHLQVFINEGNYNIREPEYHMVAEPDTPKYGKQ